MKKPLVGENFFLKVTYGVKKLGKTMEMVIVEATMPMLTVNGTANHIPKTVKVTVVKGITTAQGMMALQKVVLRAVTTALVALGTGAVSFVLCYLHTS